MGACKGLKFLLGVAALTIRVDLGNDGVKIDFRNSIGKILKKSKKKIKGHMTTVVHAVDKVIRPHALAFQPTLKADHPWIKKKPSRQSSEKVFARGAP
jgi:hypothetical protein